MSQYEKYRRNRENRLRNSNEGEHCSCEDNVAAYPPVKYRNQLDAIHCVWNRFLRVSLL